MLQNVEPRPTNESASDDFTDAEKWEEEIENGTSGPEEQNLHLYEPVTEMLDDETEVAEDVLDEEQREELEWRIDEAGDDGETV